MCCNKNRFDHVEGIHIFAYCLCAVVFIATLQCFCYTWALPRTDPQVDSTCKFISAIMFAHVAAQLVLQSLVRRFQKHVI